AWQREHEALGSPFVRSGDAPHCLGLYASRKFWGFLVTMQRASIANHSAFIWSVADLLRGDYKQSEYGRVILPLTVLRRLDCVLEPVKPAMLEKYEQVKGKVDNFGPVLDRLSEIEDLWNISPFDFGKLPDDPDHTADNLRASIHGFAPGIRDTIDKFDFGAQTPRLDKANLLYPVV